MKLFVTVGSTGFDELIDAATAPGFLSHIVSLGYTSLLIQYGSSKGIFLRNTKDYNGDGLDIQGYDYKATIEQDVKHADWIVSHSGRPRNQHCGWFSLSNEGFHFSHFVIRGRNDITSFTATQKGDCYSERVFVGQSSS
jgi:hypothetical protein